MSRRKIAAPLRRSGRGTAAAVQQGSGARGARWAQRPVEFGRRERRNFVRANTRRGLAGLDADSVHDKRWRLAAVEHMLVRCVVCLAQVQRGIVVVVMANRLIVHDGVTDDLHSCLERCRQQRRQRLPHQAKDKQQGAQASVHRAQW